MSPIGSPKYCFKFLNLIFAPIFFRIFIKPILCGFRQTFLILILLPRVKIAILIKNALDETSEGIS